MVFMNKMQVSFSPPDITQAECDAVVEAMRSGWITTGPKVKEFEHRLASPCGTQRAMCFSSATTALESILRLLGIGPGDEVITSAYTYTASCSPICHVGATPVLVDTAPGSYEMDYDALEAAITSSTKAIIPVDIAGRMCDYDRIFAAVEAKRMLFKPGVAGAGADALSGFAVGLQQAFGRPAVIADAAHSLGASYHGKPSGGVADFTTFSFHAVKNLTTAEGGALTWREHEGLDSEELYRQCNLIALHGQSKDALAKTHAGAWEYDVLWPAYKCNMTDMCAAMGLVQLDRYEGMLARRADILAAYAAGISQARASLLRHDGPDFHSSRHLCLVQLPGKGLDFRNRLIARMAELGVAANVHYKPLPMLTAYKDLGFDIARFPQAYETFTCEITLPLHTCLTDEQVAYVVEIFNRAYEECE